MSVPADREVLDCRWRLEREFIDPSRRHLRDRIRIRKRQQVAIDRETLTRLLGVQDERFVDLLCRQQADPESFASLVLVPLVLVAWADRRLCADERGAILDAAEEFGIERGSPSFNLLGQWLDYKPTGKLREAWIEYVRALCAELDGQDRRRLEDRMLARARELGSGAQGIFGLGPFSVWSAWRRSRVLDELHGAFES